MDQHSGGEPQQESVQTPEKTGTGELLAITKELLSVKILENRKGRLALGGIAVADEKVLETGAPPIEGTDELEAKLHTLKENALVRYKGEIVPTRFESRVIGNKSEPELGTTLDELVKTLSKLVSSSRTPEFIGALDEMLAQLQENLDSPEKLDLETIKGLGEECSKVAVEKQELLGSKVEERDRFDLYRKELPKNPPEQGEMELEEFLRTKSLPHEEKVKASLQIVLRAIETVKFLQNEIDTLNAVSYIAKRLAKTIKELTLDKEHEKLLAISRNLEERASTLKIPDELLAGIDETDSNANKASQDISRQLVEFSQRIHNALGGFSRDRTNAREGIRDSRTDLETQQTAIRSALTAMQAALESGNLAEASALAESLDVQGTTELHTAVYAHGQSGETRTAQFVESLSRLLDPAVVEKLRVELFDLKGEVREVEKKAVQERDNRLDTERKLEEHDTTISELKAAIAKHPAELQEAEDKGVREGQDRLAHETDLDKLALHGLTTVWNLQEVLQDTVAKARAAATEISTLKSRPTDADVARAKTEGAETAKRALLQNPDVVALAGVLNTVLDTSGGGITELVQVAVAKIHELNEELARRPAPAAGKRGGVTHR